MPKNKVTLFILLLLSIISLSSERFEVMLNRISYPNEVDVLDIVNDLDSANICDQSWSSMNFNQSYYQVPCYKKDVFYNIEIFIGDIQSQNQQYQYLNMTLDLTSPISWLKLHTCKRCPSGTQVPIFSSSISSNKLGCEESCQLNQHSSKMYKAKSKNSKTKILKKKAAIVNDNNEMVFGKYIIDTVKMNVYDEDKKLSIIEKMENQMKFNQLDNQLELLTLEQEKILGVETIIGGSEYYSDGAIGLGYVDKYGYDELFEEDTNFLFTLLRKQKDSPTRNLVWGLYLNDLSETHSDLVMTIGGVNLQYSEHETDDIVNVKATGKDRGFVWSLPIQMFSHRFESYQYIQFEEGTKAILTTSASYIGLPKKKLLELISTLQKQNGMSCKVVDQRFYQVHCNNIRRNYILDQYFSVFFFGQDREVKIDARHFFRDCDKNPFNSKNEYDRFSCILNVRLSPDQYVILGEPFLKQHYTIFYQDMNMVGFLPASKTEKFIDQYERSVIGWFVHIATFIFISGIVFILCYRNCKKLIYKIIFKIQSRNYKPDKVESQRLKVAGQDEETMYQDVETAMRDEVINQLNQINNKK